MGLDQYAYVALNAKERDDYYQSLEGKFVEGVWTVTTKTKPRDIAYWRKHPNLQGWMQRLWLQKNGFAVNSTDQFIGNKVPPNFNGIELELTREDIDCLEQDIQNRKLPFTQGFFFGSPADDYYREQDLKFCREARAELFLGLKVFYNSSW
jgi:hypothetical protein